MEKRVKIFVADSPFELEDQINEFNEDHPGKLYDIKYQYAFAYDNASQIISSDIETYTALLIYIPGEE